MKSNSASTYSNITDHSKHHGSKASNRLSQQEGEAEAKINFFQIKGLREKSNTNNTFVTSNKKPTIKSKSSNQQADLRMRSADIVSESINFSPLPDGPKKRHSFDEKIAAQSQYSSPEKDSKIDLSIFKRSGCDDIYRFAINIFLLSNIIVILILDRAMSPPALRKELSSKLTYVFGSYGSR